LKEGRIGKRQILQKGREQEKESELEWRMRKEIKE
jgi:hypothetical protein